MWNQRNFTFTRLRIEIEDGINFKSSTVLTYIDEGLKKEDGGSRGEVVK